jgi:hypothetical protein
MRSAATLAGRPRGTSWPAPGDPAARRHVAARAEPNHAGRDRGTGFGVGQIARRFFGRVRKSCDKAAEDTLAKRAEFDRRSDKFAAPANKYGEQLISLMK